VPWVGVHTFRHTFASLLFAQGRNAVQVQRWLGRHSAAFTPATYVHLLDGDIGAPLCLTEVQTSSTPTPRDLVFMRLGGGRMSPASGDLWISGACPLLRIGRMPAAPPPDTLPAELRPTRAPIGQDAAGARLARTPNDPPCPAA
jgi:hypothetical protein